ncbi:MAG: L,D-transpeptidase [Ignavibacteria bacterium]|nr:L,D-transpeptidase [Ignavibacteria bacterium]
MKRIHLLSVLIMLLFSPVIMAGVQDTVKVEAESIGEADASIGNYLREQFPIISDDIIKSITDKRTIEKVDKPLEAGGGYFYKINYIIGKNFLLDTVKILWELNIPEFRSHLYQLFGKDTIYIDTWNNVIGTAKDKTYAGHFEAYRVRNWPSWKDPEKGKEELPAVPPGPKNPLGLFVVHYDENSLRYFHGTNKPKLVYSKMRSLSHGCVRNDNDNIAKMKEFLIKRVIKSKDLSSWMDSKRTMSYDFDKVDRFPVRIIYKTYMIDRDEKGLFVELYKDIYNYSNSRNIDTKWNDESLITLSTHENLKSEFKAKSKGEVSEDKIDGLVDYVLKKLDTYERYYVKDLNY